MKLKLSQLAGDIFQQLDDLDGENSPRFDSRVLFERMNALVYVTSEGKPSPGGNVKNSHEQWLHFIHEQKSNFEALGDVEMRISPDRQAFAMLNCLQAEIIVLFSQCETIPLFTDLLDIAVYLRQEKAAHRLPIPSPLSVVFAFPPSNKTREELRVPKEPVDKTEKRIEKAFAATLTTQGIPVQHQVKCEAGIADIVTPDAIYEVKASLTRSSIQKGIAQVLAYRACINPSAKVAIVGYPHKKQPVDFEFAQALGVDVIVWEDPTNE